MARNRGIDLTPLVNLIQKSPIAAAKGAERGLDEVKDDWVVKSRDIAPLDKGNLRGQIAGKAEGDGLNTIVEVSANATSKSGKTGKEFNYAYYIHEGHMAEDGKQLRHAGTVEAFFDESADKNEQRWARMLEEEIKEELKRGGW